MLKRVELSGFKSFAGKTTLEFGKGITAIVGPNGSGKSNVIDALRWLLGEREAKNLRGGKIEDLIFAGTPMKPRVGLAQAGVFFDNSKGVFPAEFSEVAISRQVTRDGDSKYFLNKSEIRLKDLVDFFAKARLGAGGLTIIRQGDSDLFIKASPEERREMVEEILGLREYRLKKNETERKLKNSAVNLDKVAALLEEIAPHLRVLKRQASKWNRRNEIVEELKKLENLFYGSKLKEIKSGFSDLEPQMEVAVKKLSAAKKELDKVRKEVGAEENQGSEEQGEIKKVKEKIASIMDKRSELEKELGRLEGQIEILSSRKEEKVDAGAVAAFMKKLRAALDKFLRLGLEDIRMLAKSLIDEVDKLFDVKDLKSTDLDSIKKSRLKISEELGKLEEEFKNWRAKEISSASLSEEKNKILRKALVEFEVKKDEVSRLEAQMNRLNFEKERWQFRLSDLKAQVDRSSVKFADLLSGKATESEVGLEGAEKRILRLTGELASMGEIDEGLIKEAEETEKRHMFLESESADLKKAIVDLAKLKKDLEEKINGEFKFSLQSINRELARFFELMFGGGRAKLKMAEPARLTKSAGILGSEAEINIKEQNSDKEPREAAFGIDIEVAIPRKKITGLEMLSGGERSLVSVAALFALVSVSPPPFLVLDEIDAALDERNARRFAEILKDFSKKTQFVIVTHNRATMEAADVLYGVTMGEDGTSKVYSLKLE